MSPESLLAEKLAAYRAGYDKACRGLFEDSNHGSNSAAAIFDEVTRAVRFIAEDFAHEFNAKLASAIRSDPTVELVVDRYEMGPAHVGELEELLAAPVGPLLANLECDELDGARGLVEEVWARLEKRIRSKWQAYFVLTFQDVSVERKAARDRRRPSFDPALLDALASSTVAADEPPRAISAWLVVAALLALAALAGWLLMRGHMVR